MKKASGISPGRRAIYAFSQSPCDIERFFGLASWFYYPPLTQCPFYRGKTSSLSYNYGGGGSAVSVGSTVGTGVGGGKGVSVGTAVGISVGGTSAVCVGAGGCDVAVGGTGVGGTDVAVGGGGDVAVGGTGVGGTEVAVGGMDVAVAGIGVGGIWVDEGGIEVAEGETDVAVGGMGVSVSGMGLCSVGTAVKEGKGVLVSGGRSVGVGGVPDSTSVGVNVKVSVIVGVGEVVTDVPGEESVSPSSHPTIMLNRNNTTIAKQVIFHFALFLIQTPLLIPLVNKSVHLLAVILSPTTPASR
jgi:hypothetical protein